MTTKNGVTRHRNQLKISMLTGVWQVWQGFSIFVRILRRGEFIFRGHVLEKRRGFSGKTFRRFDQNIKAFFNSTYFLPVPENNIFCQGWMYSFFFRLFLHLIYNKVWSKHSKTDKIKRMLKILQNLKNDSFLKFMIFLTSYCYFQRNSGQSKLIFTTNR